MTDQVAAGDTRAETAVDATGVTVVYGDKTAVDGVDLTVRPGEVVGVIGPNGAGKTSLLECVEGLRRPVRGRIRVCGVDPLADRPGMARVSGVQLQDSAYPTRARVDEICRLFAGFHTAPQDPVELLEEFGLSDKARSQVTRLSGGQRQRLSLALALIGRPRVVFLDELTTGLDPEARKSVWDGLRRRNAEGLTVVLTSHHMDEVEYLCDRVSVMADGVFVATGTVTELVDRHAPVRRRLTVERAKGLDALSGELDRLGPGVSVEATGSRLRVDVGDEALMGGVDAALRAHEAVSRETAIGLDDAYTALTGRSTVSEGA